MGKKDIEIVTFVWPVVKVARAAVRNILWVLISLVIGIIMTEILLRGIAFKPEFLGVEQSHFRLNKQDLTKYFVLDPEFGFRPALSNGSYNEFGTKVNSYDIRKMPGTTRLLFMGDSVTARGKIINGLRKLYGEQEFEYWNAGVESFNTIQEVKFYERYNRQINPDHVILFFHLNDFQTTPVAFLNNENKIVVYSPYQSTTLANRWLVQHSALYRIVVANYLKLVYKNAGSKIAKEVKDEVSDSVKMFQNALAQEEIKFTVVILPILDSYDKWSSEERESRSDILNLVCGLNIEHIDLTEAIYSLSSEPLDIVKLNLLSPAIHGGEYLLSIDEDRLHPDDRLAMYFADFLYKKKIF